MVKGGGEIKKKKKVEGREGRENQSSQVWIKMNKGKPILHHFPILLGNEGHHLCPKKVPVPSEPLPTPILWALGKHSSFSSQNTFISVHILYLQPCEKKFTSDPPPGSVSDSPPHLPLPHVLSNRRSLELRPCLLNSYREASKAGQRKAYDKGLNRWETQRTMGRAFRDLRRNPLLASANRAREGRQLWKAERGHILSVTASGKYCLTSHKSGSKKGFYQRHLEVSLIPSTPVTGITSSYGYHLLVAMGCL